MEKSAVITFRADRQLIDQLAGPQRGAGARLLRRLLAEEARRHGIVVAAEMRRRPAPRKSA